MAFAPLSWDNKSITSCFIYFRGILPRSENWGLYQNNYSQRVCILALNATKEAIRLGGVGGGGGGGVEKINLAT